jgi:peptidoglycan/xylan/chitin deacetylase (PgdA/CDA1 family)
MPFYVPAYDTEAVYAWWERGGQRYNPSSYSETVSYEGARLQAFLAGVRAVAEVHLTLKLPATFFVVAKLLENAASELVQILDQPNFDVQCHSYSHADVIRASQDEAALRHELVDSKRLIEDTFGRPVIGFTTPAGYWGGLAGQPRVLAALWEAGYRYVRSFGMGPGGTIPAPLTQPYWYTQDGYPDLLELGLHAWHDNVLTGQPHRVHWPPILPWGYPAQMPRTPEEVYRAYAPGIDYVVEQGLLTYVPCFHPWSVYRLDRGARQVELLLMHAQRVTDIASCTSVYETICEKRSLASESLQIEGRRKHRFAHSDWRESTLSARPSPRQGPVEGRF